jgi:hypothetical protein
MKASTWSSEIMFRAMVNAVLASVASLRMMYSTSCPAISLGKKSKAPL